MKLEMRQTNQKNSRNKGPLSQAQKAKLWNKVTTTQRCKHGRTQPQCMYSSDHTDTDTDTCRRHFWKKTLHPRNQKNKAATERSSTRQTKHTQKRQSESFQHNAKQTYSRGIECCSRGRSGRRWGRRGGRWRRGWRSGSGRWGREGHDLLFNLLLVCIDDQGSQSHSKKE